MGSRRAIADLLRGKPVGQARVLLRHALVSWTLWAVGLVVLALGMANRNPEVLAAGAVVLLVACVARVLVSIRSGYVALAVVIAFALFLMSRLLTSVVFHYPPESADAFGMPFNRNDVNSHVFLSLGLALAAFFLSFQFLSSLDRLRAASRGPVAPSAFVLTARAVSLGLFVVALPIRVGLDVEAAVFVARHNYLAYYTDFETALPAPVRILGGAYQVAFLAFLATNPGKRAVAIPAAAYVAAATVSLASGQRTEFVLNIVVVVLYMYYRHVIDGPSVRWVTFRTKMGAAVAVPLILALVGIVARMRATPSRTTSGLLDPVLEILHSQGVSVEVIGYGYVYRAQVAHDHVYTFGPLLDSVQHRLPALLGIGTDALTGQTVERATSSGLFSHMISHLVLGDRYLSGAGMGSSFVAELWADFSYTGVVVGSLMIGLIVVALTAGLQHSWWTRLFALLLIREIMLVPRSGATQFIVEAFTASTVVGTVLILGVTWALMRYRSSGRAPAARGREHLQAAADSGKRPPR